MILSSCSIWVAMNPANNSANATCAALRRRLKEIPDEIERESAHIRSRFRDPSARLFPVAVTWLIPRRAVLEITGART